MRKIVSFIAIAAAVLGMMGCNGEEPEPHFIDFEFKVEALSTKYHCIITPNALGRDYVWNVLQDGEYEGDNAAQQVKKYIELVESQPFQALKKAGFIVDGPFERTIDERTADTEYIVLACYVEEDAETGKTNVVGEMAYKAFKTMPIATLNGEFSVSETKKVHFAQSNMQKVSSSPGFIFTDNQWDYIGSTITYPIDTYEWSAIGDISPSSPWSVPSAEEWWFLFIERYNAAGLFAHATVADVQGVIILPDNWQTPEGVKLTTSAQMGMDWNDKQTKREYEVDDSFDAYAVNQYTEQQWEVLEFAGALFLPAEKDYNRFGWYWSSSERSEDAAHAFSFSHNTLSPSPLRSPGSIQKNSKCALRPARVLD